MRVSACLTVTAVSAIGAEDHPGDSVRIEQTTYGVAENQSNEHGFVVVMGTSTGIGAASVSRLASLPTLASGSAGIVAIYDHDGADANAGALGSAIRTSTTQIDTASRDELTSRPRGGICMTRGLRDDRADRGAPRRRRRV
jgi:hypothetical protein